MKKTLIISAGHNPDATGASWNNLKEYTETEKWVNYIQGRLEKSDKVDVYRIPPVGLKSKVAEVNSVVGGVGRDNVLAVELHFNAAGKTFVRGIETLYYPGSTKGEQAALRFNRKYMLIMKNEYGIEIKNRGAKAGWYRMDAPGVVDYAGDVDGDEKPDYFLAKTACTALILEPHFLCELENMDNWTDSASAVADALEAVMGS